MMNGEVRQKVIGAVYEVVYWSSHENADRAVGEAVIRAVYQVVYRRGYRAVHMAIAPHKEPLHPELWRYLGVVTW